MNLNHLKKIKLTNTHKGILAGLGLLVLIVGFAYFFYPVMEGYKYKIFQPKTNKELKDAVDFWVKDKQSAYIKYDSDINTWDTSKITSMKNLFKNHKSFNDDISRWNTSNVTDMSFMFYHAFNFNQDISNWDTSKVKNMSYMFNTATKFNQDISRWNTTNVTNMTYMFYKATSFNQPNIFYKWDISSVRRETPGMYKISGVFGMFANSKKMEECLPKPLYQDTVFLIILKYLCIPG